MRWRAGGAPYPAPTRFCAHFWRHAPAALRESTLRTFAHPTSLVHIRRSCDFMVLVRCGVLFGFSLWNAGAGISDHLDGLLRLPSYPRTAADGNIFHLPLSTPRTLMAAPRIRRARTGAAKERRVLPGKRCAHISISAAAVAAQSRRAFAACSATWNSVGWLGAAMDGRQRWAGDA